MWHVDGSGIEGRAGMAMAGGRERRRRMRAAQLAQESDSLLLVDIAPPDEELLLIDLAPADTPSNNPETLAPSEQVEGDSPRARLGMTLEIHGMRMTSEALHVRFELFLANRGELAAEGGLLRIALQQASAQQQLMLEMFFGGAGGSLMAEDIVVKPGQVSSITSEAILPFDQCTPLLIGDQKMIIPVIAFDATYHWEGEVESFGQNACAFVLGLEAPDSDGNDKLGPIRLDLPPRNLTRFGARVTKLQRQL